MVANEIAVGDACSIDLADGAVDLIVTDPPYGTSYISNKQTCDTRSGTTQAGRKSEKYFGSIANDADVPTDWLREAYRVLKDGGALYVFCHWTRWGKLSSAVEMAGFKVKNMIVIDKSNHGMGDLKGQYAPKHELLLFAHKGRHIVQFPDGRQNDVWNLKVLYSGAKRHHPCEKPVSWMSPAIVNSSDVGDLVLDPFCGSGSTLIAALMHQRRFIGIDISADWVEVARQRVFGSGGNLSDGDASAPPSPEKNEETK